MLRFLHLALFGCLASLVIAQTTSFTATESDEIPGQRTCASHEKFVEMMGLPRFNEARTRIEAHARKWAPTIAEERSGSNSTVITIPVVFHIVYNGPTQNISDAQIMSQLNILNDDFRRLNSDADDTWSQAADTEVEFCLASLNPQGSATSGIVRIPTNVNGFGTGDAVKFTSQGGSDAWPASEYLNFWVCDIGGGILGYAQFPGGPASTDGVVCGYQYVGNIGTATAPFDLGRTATHEVGHWLNLYHIWGDGGCSVDDGIADTPSSDGANFGCATGHVSCSTTDMVQNYMDYSDDYCMNLFTEGQKARMLALFSPGGVRAGLMSSSGCGPGCETACGCTDTTACNYDASAENDDGSCDFSCYGCTDSTACNYDPEATNDDGSCFMQDPCSCELAGEQFAALSAEETSAPLELMANSLSDLTTISIELEFNNTGGGDSWAADLAMAITSPSGQCASFGGYNSSPGNCSSLGNYAAIWPGSWQSASSGTYTTTVDLSAAGLSGSGTWGVVLHNGYSGSDGVEYAISWVIENLCPQEETPEGCTDPTACNYDSDATEDDGSCAEFDACGVCDGPETDSDGDGIADCNETTTFTGNVDESWGDSGNWDHGVPSTHDAVVITGGSTVVIHTTAVIPTGSTMTNDGALTVNGSFLNEGSMINYNLLTSIGTINNSGALMNVGTLTNLGTLTNESSLVNDGSIYTCDGVFVNTGSLMNNGTIYMMTTWYQDDDGDGAGDPNSSVEACSDSPPAGFVDIAGDECPFDSDKTEAGICGCGVADTDADGDGVADCIGCPEDLNGNGAVEVGDLLILLGDFGCLENCSADIDGDGAVAVSDILLLLAAFGDDC